MSRKTVTFPKDVFDRLDDLKHDDESWPEFGERVADVLEAQDGDVNTETNTVVVDNVEEIARASAGEVENRMTRR